MQEKNTHPNQNSYLYDSMNTRVPPINISGKKLPNSRTKFETPSPLSHSKSYQHFPNPNIYLREESPQRMMLSPPNHLIREISHPIMPKYYENERILVTPPPIIKSIRPVAYRPALINLNNRIPNYNMNLNPFEVVEQLFFEENTRREHTKKKTTLKIERNKVEKGTDPIINDYQEKPAKKIEEEKISLKNINENIPTVPNENKSDPNIKIASYANSPIQKKSFAKNDSFPKSHDNSYILKRNINKQQLDEKRKFIKALLEEIDGFLLKQREVDKQREKELNTIKVA